MNVLVTGGAGFIGAHYVEHILKKGDQAVVLDNFSNSSGAPLLRAIEGPNLQVIRGDVRDLDVVSTLVSKSELVVNFAAWTHNDTALLDPKSFLESNTLGSMQLLESCRKHNVRYHHVSTDEIYGDLPIESAIEFDESASMRPSNPYSASKAAADLLVKAWHRTFGVKTTISVTCNNFGAYQNTEKFIPRQILKLIMGEPQELYGDGSNVREWIPVGLNVKCIDKIAKSSFFGEVFNIGSSVRISNIEVAQMLSEISGVGNSEIRFVPDRLGHDLKYAINNSKYLSFFGEEDLHFDMYEELKGTFRWYENNKGIWV